MQNNINLYVDLIQKKKEIKTRKTKRVKRMQKVKRLEFLTALAVGFVFWTISAFLALLVYC